MRISTSVLLRAAVLAVFLTTAAAAVHAAPGPLPPPADVNIFFTPPYLITTPQPPFTLRAVFRRLAHAETGQRAFTETRKFAISKNPVRASGTLRYGRSIGLSIAYDGAAGRVLIIDDQGLIERSAGGHERSVSVNDRPELAALTDVYLNLLRGNSAKLFAASNAYYAGERGTGWQLGLVAKDESIARRIGRAVVYGRGRDITRIDTISPSGETRSLALGPLMNNVRFTPEEMKTYFRGE
ncbi:MAG: hypothetical protein JO117_03640 [Verrucomicrobia bacterium]|nr:hypothetical protein [Verrucomicrobiota bacterium]